MPVSNSSSESMNVRLVNGNYHRGTGGWEELFDYGGIRYHARLFPSLDGNGIQDDMLLSLARACEEYDDIMDDYADECRRLIWPLIEQDYASRSESEKTDLSPSKATVRIEGRMVDGKLQAFTHKWNLDYSTHPIPNTFPGVPTFSDNLVHRIERLDPEVFKVEHNGQFYCLKTVHSKGGETGLKREISILQRCHHPNIVACCGVLVNQNKRIEGIMMEFIPDTVTLDQVIDSESGFDKKQCLLWISQIESALEYLRSNSLVWGDAKPANILKRPNDDLVLVDFAGGATEKWVDCKNMDTLAGDLQGLERIKQVLWSKVDTSSTE